MASIRRDAERVAGETGQEAGEGIDSFDSDQPSNFQRQGFDHLDEVTSGDLWLKRA
ncbi:hypothetical protein FRC17_009360 [Serendipita sp. 399]|nr:hypothetical protein FRC17_009360 [Serendipita sp. 399]